MRITMTLLLSALVVLATSNSAPAVCGDVSGDDKITSNDALRVLRKSVGQPVELTCDVPVLEIENWLGFTNTLACNNSGVNAQMTWSRRPALSWSDYTQSSPPFDADYRRVDEILIDGVITMTFGACGSVQFDIDSWGVAYVMPPIGGAWIFPWYDAAEGFVYLMIELTPLETAALQYGDAVSPVAVLASAPAPAGLANAQDR